MILFLGIAGAGKSKQGKMLADELGFPWLSTGEFLRMLLSGEERRQLVTGKLLSDSQIIKLVQKIFGLIDVEKEFVLDGFPRSERQVDWLLNQVEHGQLHVSAAIHIKISENDVKGRLKQRGRQDDNNTAIEERLREYKTVTAPMLSHLKKNNIPIIEINGAQSIEKVHQDIISSLNPYL